ncbi:hypothetical protein TWF730_003866 [Orbilia blumenaviensis]|uniref:Acyl-protein thioesterase 1 n=1 Tax=Orbilia blumenaviensis TaxID=1796055 RepID=A0AAV9U137_9PEZI
MAEHEPLRIFEAMTPPHQSTVIFLHGRGDTGSNVAPFLLYTPINSEHSEASRRNSEITFRHLLPHTKFVFPTALKRRIGKLPQGGFNQWFDMDSLIITDYYDDGQIEGVKESTDYIHQLIQAEVDSGIPPEQIVLMGISQGCATGAAAMMRYPGKLGGFVGMSGWLPFITESENILRDGGDSKTLLQHFENKLGNNREVTEESAGQTLKTPIFIGHGTADTKIVPRCGERLRHVLKGAGFEEVVWATYMVGHWWCDEELIHIAVWLKLKGFSVNKIETFIGDTVGSLGSQGVSYTTN